MSLRFLRLMIFTLAFVAGSCAVPPLWSQGAPPVQRLPHQSDTGFANAANRWQLTAISPDSQVDTVDPPVRAQRNAYWKAPLEAIRGLEVFPGPYLSDAPEFPTVKGAAWVIATFESFHVFTIVPDYQLIYTEMNFRVEQVVKQPTYLFLSTGSLIDTDFAGGRIRTPKGDIVSSHVSPFEHFFQPGHKYLLQVVYNAGGGFYWAYKRWDLSSGKVKPDDPGEMYRAAHGNSSIDGMSVSDLANFLPTVLPDEPEK